MRGSLFFPGLFVYTYGNDPGDSCHRHEISELRTNEKECAEHIMLGNDLGRIAAYGSVRADELMVIETYYYVMHLVSEVPETHAEGKDAFNVIRAAVPGAPKVRTMEISEELEPVRRRPPYTGSFGWIDYNGDLELNIIIRTLVMKDQIGSIQAGAGIVTIPNRNGNMPNV